MKNAIGTSKNPIEKAQNLRNRKQRSRSRKLEQTYKTLYENEQEKSAYSLKELESEQHRNLELENDIVEQSNKETGRKNKETS